MGTATAVFTSAPTPEVSVTGPTRVTTSRPRLVWTQWRRRGPHAAACIDGGHELYVVFPGRRGGPVELEDRNWRMGRREVTSSVANAKAVAECLGDHIFEWFLRNKRAEWRGYKTHVSQYELNRYLRSL